MYLARSALRCYHVVFDRFFSHRLEDREAWDGIPGWRPVRRADIEAAVGRVRAALSRPPYSAD